MAPSTGPEYHAESEAGLELLFDKDTPGSEKLALGLGALVSASLARNALLLAVAQGMSALTPHEAKAWRQAIPMPPLTECTSGARREACEKWHTEDCPYTEDVLADGMRVRRKHRGSFMYGTVAESKRLASGKMRVRVQWDGAELTWVDQTEVGIVRHEKLPVGTRVLVSDSMTVYDYRVELGSHPYTGQIVGHPSNGTYLIAREYGPGHYGTEHPSYVFMDERVQVHPDGPECPPDSAAKRAQLPLSERSCTCCADNQCECEGRRVVSEAVSQEPTGPRIYVENTRGKQGHILEMKRQDENTTAVRVQWYSPGTRPVWIDLGMMKIIPFEDVDVCDNGKTKLECASGENRCDMCLADEDAEAEAIERSMGL